MDMSITEQCLAFWTIAEGEVNTLIPAHLKNLLRLVYGKLFVLLANNAEKIARCRTICISINVYFSVLLDIPLLSQYKN